MENLDSYCQKAIELGLEGAKIIDPRSIVTAEWVRMKCQFGCTGFGMRHCCPPYSPTPETTRKVLDCYEKAILLHKRLQKSGRGKAGMGSKGFNATVVKLETELFLAGYYKAWSMGSGPCRRCETCDPSGLCRHGMEARPSMEACGIDVFKTVRDNGFSIEVVQDRDDARDLFGVVLVE